MNHHPPDDRRISGGAVVAAWAIVAGLVAVTLFLSVLAKPAPMPIPLTARADTQVEGRAALHDDPNGSLGD
jgi:hypothetical protein